MLSFIIPTLNEEENIGEVIDSIKTCLPCNYNYEIVVIDNGSVDSTVKVAKAKGARVYSRPNDTISALRNYGVINTSGEFIVFLDSDVLLKNNWGSRIGNILSDLKSKPLTVTGSICGIRGNACWIEKYWFLPILNRKKINYINSGHLILHRNTFSIVGGFNEKLMTGEDYEFCQRAQQKGIRIINNTKLEVVHLGYPQTLFAFFKRERWHGLGDYVSLMTIMTSKPAILSLSQLLVLIVSIIGALLLNNFAVLFFYVLYMILICLGSAAIRCRNRFGSIVPCALLYSVYFIARTFAFFDMFAECLFESNKCAKM